MHDAGSTTALPPQASAVSRPRLLRPRTWGRRQWLFALGVALLCTGCGLGFWWYHTEPERWYQRALLAMECGDQEEVDRLVLRLHDRGRHDEAHFVRGKAQVLAGRALNQELLQAARGEQVDQALRLLLDLGGQLAQAAQPVGPRIDVVCQENTAAAPWAQSRPASRRRVELQERIRAALESGAREFGQMQGETPLRVEAGALTGDCLFRLGDLRAAAQVLAYVVDQKPDDVESHRLLAALYFDLGAMGRAEYHAKEVARLDPEDGRPLRLIGSIHKDFRNAEQASVAYRAALERKLSPAARSEVVRELTELLVEDLGKDQEALQTLEQIPPGWRDSPDVWVLRATCIWRSPDKTEAIRLLDAALRADPELPVALVLRAKLHLHYEEPEAAIHLLERAARIDPHDYKTQNQLAGAYRLRAQQMEEELLAVAAAQALGGAADLSGAQPPVAAHVWLAARTGQWQVLRQRAEKHQQASEEVKDALTKLTHLSRQAGMEPWNAQLRFEIAEIWAGMDRPQMTRMWLNAALICDPDHAGARTALRKLVEPGKPPE